MQYVGKETYSDKELKQIFKNSSFKLKWHFFNFQVLHQLCWSKQYSSSPILGLHLSRLLCKWRREINFC